MQADATCTEADVANITAIGMPASLADRSQLIHMLEVTTRGCVRCILQTVASVCGDDCVKDRLHIRTGRERPNCAPVALASDRSKATWI